MAYVETTSDPTEGETISTGEYDIQQHYDDIRFESPYYAAKFYLDGDLIGYCVMNYTLNHAQRSYVFTVETDYTWRIDIYNDDTHQWQTGTTHNLTVLDVPVKPTNPSPTNNDTKVDFSGFYLSWTTGADTDSFDVWIGPSGSLVRVSQEQVGTNYTTNIGEVPLNQKIYWRVDANGGGTTTEGDTWNFDARPGKVVTTTPADEATGIHLNDTTASWESPSGNTDSYNVLYGTLSGFLSLVGNTTDLFIDLVEGNFPQHGEIYYWRVNAVNDFGTTVGDELYFTTIIFKPVLPTGLSLVNGAVTGTVTGENNMVTLRKLVAVAYSKIWIEDI